MKSIKLSDWCKENSISYSAGWRMFNAGKLPNAKQLPTGTIIIVEEDQVVNTKPEYNVVYARVSSNEQAKTNLVTQADRVSRFIEARGKTVNRVVKEVGSGLNDFCSRLYGLRRSKRKTEDLIKALQSDNG